MASCKCPDVSTFKKRLTIQSVSRVSDGQGGSTESWTDGATVWASLEPLKAYEKFQASQIQVPVTHRITMRYRSDVTAASRFTLGTRIFYVKEVINMNEESRFLVIKAIENQ